MIDVVDDALVLRYDAGLSVPNSWTLAAGGVRIRFRLSDVAQELSADVPLRWLRDPLVSRPFAPAAHIRFLDETTIEVEKWVVVEGMLPIGLVLTDANEYAVAHLGKL